MPNVINHQGFIRFRGLSDAECVRWWREWGNENDRLEDTGESMWILDEELGLD